MKDDDRDPEQVDSVQEQRATTERDSPRGPRRFKFRPPFVGNRPGVQGRPAPNFRRGNYPPK